MRIFAWCATALIALVGLAELVLRLAGVLDFPLFSAGPPYGYIPKPNQSGSFLHKNDWAFNELSMGVAKRFETSGTAVDALLIGDSIVAGGNPYRQTDRLGPQLEKRLGGRVWPISANSWSLENELTYIEKNHYVATHTDIFVFVTNSEDFRSASTWSSPITHPQKRPASALLYTLEKKMSPIPRAVSTSYDPAADWLAFRKTNTQPTFVIAYPTKLEANDEKLRERSLLAPIRKIVGTSATVVDVGADPRWSAAYYRDNIHPDPRGTSLLAQICAESITKNR